MSANFINQSNVCIFEGRLVRTPTFSQIPYGQGQTLEKAVFCVAVDRNLSSEQRQKVKNGDQSIKTTDFVSFSLVGKAVDTLRQYFPVGKAIKVIAHYTEYTTTDGQTGQKKYGHIFEADSIGFVVQDAKNLQNNSGGQSQPSSGGQQPSAQHTTPPPSAPSGGFSMFDEDNQPF